jgi:hypothetical protein
MQPDREHHPLGAVIAGGKRLVMALLAVAALSPAALAQTTCFGGPAVMTCLSANGPVQVSCFGNSKFRTCITPQGQSFALSNTGGNNTNPSSSASLQTQSGATMVPSSSAQTSSGPTMIPNSSASQTTVPRPTANPGQSPAPR